MNAKKNFWTMEAVHAKVCAAFRDEAKKPDALDSIKEYGIDDFFMDYDRYMVSLDTSHYISPDNAIINALNNARLYIFAAKLYHGSKQHWRRKP